MNSTINNTTVIIYQSELEYLSRYTLDYPNIETGGQLFGFWKEDGTPVVTFVIGPGEKANHEHSFFQQDIEYLEKIGSVLTTYHGLKHIGEWHSHHKLGLDHPSGHDAANIQNKVDEYGFSQFLLCIGTVANITSSITPYIFVNSGNNYTKAQWSVIYGMSPSREKIGRSENVLLPKTEIAHYSVDKIDYSGVLSIPDTIRKVESYWFSNKSNHSVLKKVVDEINQLGVEACRVFMDDDKHVFLEISKNQNKIKILFPDGFPQEPPIVEFMQCGSDKKCDWKYDGDIYNSFITYYKQLIK